MAYEYTIVFPARDKRQSPQRTRPTAIYLVLDRMLHCENLVTRPLIPAVCCQLQHGADRQRLMLQGTNHWPQRLSVPLSHAPRQGRAIEAIAGRPPNL